MDLLSGRAQMAISLGFHIIFAAIGIAMPFFMAVSHWKWLRTKDETYLHLTKAWSKGVAIFFATGAVSGTVLSFELGLLWPKFMKHAGPVIGMPFSWEGAAFFLEAIALGLFLYGWGLLRPWIHWATGVAVGASGLLSGFIVMCANAWMNSPAGFNLSGGSFVDIDPAAAMFNRASLPMGLHMSIAAFEATGFAVAGLHAFLLLRAARFLDVHDAVRYEFHRKAIMISLAFAAVAGLAQPVSGHLLAQGTSSRQPAKFAAMEALFQSQAAAPLLIGGIPDVSARTVRYGIHVPGMLSFLAHSDLNAEVQGLDRIPVEEWPPVSITHFGFQSMVAIGGLLLLLSIIAILLIRRESSALDKRWFLLALSLCTPLGFIALESGWIVTEVGRQPWIIHRVMRTAEALTPMPGLIVPLLLFSAVYIFLAVMVIWLMTRQIRGLRWTD